MRYPCVIYCVEIIPGPSAWDAGVPYWLMVWSQERDVASVARASQISISNALALQEPPRGLASRFN